MRDPSYFMLVMLESGDLASLTIIRRPNEFKAQLASYGFLEAAGASSPLFEHISTGAFLDVVSGVFSVSRGRLYSYIIPPGVSKIDWLSGLEKRAEDLRFTVVDRDGFHAYSMLVL